jgi:hypothetical protein
MGLRGFFVSADDVTPSTRMTLIGYRAAAFDTILAGDFERYEGAA